MGLLLGRGVFPKICSNDIFMVKFVAHELLVEIKSKYLIILFPPSPPPSLSTFLPFYLPPSLLTSPTLFFFCSKYKFFLHLFLKNKLSKSSSTEAQSQSKPWQNLFLIGLSVSAS